MNKVAATIALLVVSNTFMTFAWYAHLRDLSHKPWIIAALLSWSIALCEYLFQVPANRIGYSILSLAQLKIIQEVITLSVFVPFAILYMRQSWSWNYLWAALCLMGSVFFIFREPGKPMAEPAAASYIECATSPFSAFSSSVMLEGQPLQNVLAFRRKAEFLTKKYDNFSGNGVRCVRHPGKFMLLLKRKGKCNERQV